MASDPFASLIRKQTWQAGLHRLSGSLARPWRPTRLDRDPTGPANLLLIGVDTLRADHLGLAGYGRPTSPRLDGLAGRGAAFLDVTAPAPWTLPSFSSALTGLMPGLHGAYLAGAERNMDRQPPHRLDPKVTTLAAHLRRQGYRTAAFYSNQFFAFGLAESFDHHRYLNFPAGDLARTALDWMRRHGDRPFFCFVLFNDPHEPTTPAPADLDAFLPVAGRPDPALLRGLARWGEDPAPALGSGPWPPAEDVTAALALKLAVYDATIHQVDRAIGSLQDQLERWEIADRTLVSVFSDHGEEFLDHADFSRRWNHDPRGIHGIGHGHSLFREVLGVPWLAWGPGVPAGVRRREPASLLDLSPTLLDWLDLPPLPYPERIPEDMRPQLTGRSLATGRADDGADDRFILSEAIAYGPDLVAARQGPWKLIAHRDGRPLALFDLVNDGPEEYDAAGDRPEIVRSLQDVLARWGRSGTGAEGDLPDGSWGDLDDTIRRRLKDLGYSS
ncbi:MAG: sulfatase [Candidatus Krumholzibacteriia bacterium]